MRSRRAQIVAARVVACAAFLTIQACILVFMIPSRPLYFGLLLVFGAAALVHAYLTRHPPRSGAQARGERDGAGARALTNRERMLGAFGRPGPAVRDPA
jgi:hypothetical protein